MAPEIQYSKSGDLEAVKFAPQLELRFSKDFTMSATTNVIAPDGQAANIGATNLAMKTKYVETGFSYQDKRMTMTSAKFNLAKDASLSFTGEDMKDITLSTKYVTATKDSLALNYEGSNLNVSKGKFEFKHEKYSYLNTKDMNRVAIGNYAYTEDRKNDITSFVTPKGSYISTPKEDRLITGKMELARSKTQDKTWSLKADNKTYAYSEATGGIYYKDKDLELRFDGENSMLKTSKFAISKNELAYTDSKIKVAYNKTKDLITLGLKNNMTLSYNNGAFALGNYNVGNLSLKQIGFNQKSVLLSASYAANDLNANLGYDENGVNFKVEYTMTF